MPAPTRVKAAEFRRMWSEESLPAQAIANHLNVNRRTVTSIARSLGEKLRTDTRPSRRHIGPEQMPEFRSMWQARVKARDMATHFGCHWRSIHGTAEREGLPSRGRGHHASFITLSDYRAIQLRQAMAVSAKAEQAAAKALWFGDAA